MKRDVFLQLKAQGLIDRANARALRRGMRQVSGRAARRANGQVASAGAGKRFRQQQAAYLAVRKPWQQRDASS